MMKKTKKKCGGGLIFHSRKEMTGWVGRTRTSAHTHMQCEAGLVSAFRDQSDTSGNTHDICNLKLILVNLSIIGI